MTKGKLTKDRVIHEAGQLMNRTGYLATPLSSVLEAVNLQKGGFYNHFTSKDELAREGFQANARQLGTYLDSVANDIDDPEQRLWALFEASMAIAEDRVIAGGCPILNAGTESDDSSEPLRALVSHALEGLRQKLLAPLQLLELQGRLANDAETLSWTLLAALEGGILIRRVSQNPQNQAAVLAGIRVLLKQFLRSVAP